MRRYKRDVIERARVKNQLRRQRGVCKQRNERLAVAMSLPPIRPVDSRLVFELATHNPRTGHLHHLEIKHEMENGNNRFNVYLDGACWRNQWSRSGFVTWLFEQIDRVIVDWE